MIQHVVGASPDHKLKIQVRAAAPRALYSRIALQNASRWAREVVGALPCSQRRHDTDFPRELVDLGAIHVTHDLVSIPSSSARPLPKLR